MGTLYIRDEKTAQLQPVKIDDSPSVPVVNLRNKKTAGISSITVIDNSDNTYSINSPDSALLTIVAGG